MADNKIHHGRNIKRFRELFGLKQEALALEALEQNKQLYERLLQSEREKVELLEKFLKERPF